MIVNRLLRRSQRGGKLVGILPAFRPDVSCERGSGDVGH
jgi:hypothetical protein